MRPLLSLLCCAALLRAEDELPPACDPADAGGPTALLRGGATIPQVGLGTWQSAPGEVGAAVRAALRAGYRHLDCAAVYGNEKEIGAVLGELVGDGPGQIPRGELFVTSKLFNSEHAPTDVRPALEQTLADLQLDYLDLYLIHWPQAFAKVEGTHAGRPTHPNVRTPRSRRGVFHPDAVLGRGRWCTTSRRARRPPGARWRPASRQASRAI
eukprot:COSAG04_NODE_589_length_12295_cov_12.315513_10_plen_211_part_00